ncbi:MAG TPA: hypothetical protein VG603_07000 [Chitinophagales bacterium]|nr:hypothetical protein [Chitinophagales bacterium]
MAFHRPKPGHLFFMVLFFACVGVTTEVVFTAFMALFTQSPLCGSQLPAMAGKSYVWMLFIYGLIPILGVYFHHHIKHWNVFARLLLYVAILYVIEFVSGYLLQLTTGSCPWLYHGGHNIMGLIQLDYAPAWAFFAWMVESLYLYINARVIQ